MAKANIKYTPIEVFDIDFAVIWGKSAADCYEFVYQEFYDFNEDDMPLDPTHRVASAIHCLSRRKSEDSDWKANFVMVLPENTGGQEDRSIVHEAVHLSWYVIEFLGMEIDYLDHEIQSRLVEYFYESAKRTIGKTK